MGVSLSRDMRTLFGALCIGILFNRNQKVGTPGDKGIMRTGKPKVFACFMFFLLLMVSGT